MTRPNTNQTDRDYLADGLVLDSQPAHDDTDTTTGQAE